MLDTGNYRVQVFDEGGNLLHSFGRQGKGPSEFMRPDWFARLGDSIIVYDVPTGRFSAWSPTGEHLGDHSVDTRFRPRVVLGWGDRLIAGFAEELEDGSASKRASGRSDFDWDDLLPAIDSFRVDGHGHLWVLPTVPGTGVGEPGPSAAPRLRPVDVYGSDGELLFSGMVDAYPWHVSRGDFVYRIGIDAESEDQVVFRYAVREPFEP